MLEIFYLVNNFVCLFLFFYIFRFPLELMSLDWVGYLAELVKLCATPYLACHFWRLLRWVTQLFFLILFIFLCVCIFFSPLFFPGHGALWGRLSWSIFFCLWNLLLNKKLRTQKKKTFYFYLFHKTTLISSYFNRLRLKTWCCWGNRCVTAINTCRGFIRFHPLNIIRAT